MLIVYVQTLETALVLHVCGSNSEVMNVNLLVKQEDLEMELALLFLIKMFNVVVISDKK